MFCISSDISLKAVLYDAYLLRYLWAVFYIKMLLVSPQWWDQRLAEDCLGWVWMLENIDREIASRTEPLRRNTVTGVPRSFLFINFGFTFHPFWHLPPFRVRTMDGCQSRDTIRVSYFIVAKNWNPQTDSFVLYDCVPWWSV